MPSASWATARRSVPATFTAVVSSALKIVHSPFIGRIRISNKEFRTQKEDAGLRHSKFDIPGL